MRRLVPLFVFTLVSMAIGVAAEKRPDVSMLSKARFEPNVGQAGTTNAKFIARFGSRTALLGPGYIELPSPGSTDSRVRLEFVGANDDVTLVATEPLGMKVNYFHGGREDWRTDVPTFAAVRYRDLYPGIDLMVHASPEGRGLEYDFEVASGADLTPVAMRFYGADRIGLSFDSSAVLIEAAAGVLTQPKAVAYQRINGQRIVVPVRYELASNILRLKLAEYRQDVPLTIDPALFYSAGIGGDADSEILANATAVYTDGSGHSHTYLGGVVRLRDAHPQTGSGLPTKNAYSTVAGPGFIAKFDASLSGDPSVIYVTYFDGVVNSMAVDANGNLYAAGGTSSTSFPIVNGYASIGRAFLAKLSPDGATLLYSTLSGSFGACGGCPESFTGVAVTADGTAFMTGNTQAPNLPQRNAIAPYRTGETTFIQAANTTSSGDVSLLYSSYFNAKAVEIHAIALDSARRIYIAGSALYGSDFPVVNGFSSTLNHYYYYGSTPFAAVIDPSRTGVAQVVYSTLISGPVANDDYIGGAFAVAVDAAGVMYVGGSTADPNIARPGAFQTTPRTKAGNAFIAKINPAIAGAGSLLAATYAGGQDTDAVRGLALDVAGNLFATGYAISPDFPVVNPTTPSTSGLFESLDRGNTWLAVGHSPELTIWGDQVLAMDPSTSPRTFYLGTVSGVYKSSDGGLSWSPANNGLGCKFILGLAMDPLHPSTLFAVTNVDVYRTTDGGSSWTSAGSGLGWDSSGPCEIGSFPTPKLLFDGNRLYLAWYGLYRTPLSDPISWTTLTAEDVFSVAVDAITTPHTIYVASEEWIAKSSDDGSTFLLPLLSSWKGGFAGIGVDPANGTVWENETGDLAKSTDRGVTWTHDDSRPFSAGGGRQFVFDASTSPSTIYLGGGVSWLYGGPMSVSRDGGTTWGVSLALMFPSYGFSAPVLDPGATPRPVYIYGAGSDSAFVAEFDGSLSTLKFSTILGGIGGGSEGKGIALDPKGNIYVAGSSASPNFPMLNSYAPPKPYGQGSTLLAGANNAFLSVLGSPILPASSSGPVSTTIGTSTGTLSVTFPDITGSTTSSSPTVDVTPLSNTQTANFSLSNNLGAFDISTTATFSGSVTLCFQVLVINDVSTFNALTLLHVENGVAVDITRSRDFASRTICGSTTSFSPFIVVKGVAGQIQDLIKAVNALDLKKGIQTSLDSKLQNAQSAYASAASHDYASVCNIMSAFISAVQAQIGQPLTTADAAPLIAAAKQIKATVGCK